ncbi:hypothetical protein ABFS83_03G000100 [Erythranthe nasuta]
MLHGPSHAAALKRMQRKTKRGTFNRHDTNTIGTQHRKPTPIKAHLNRQLKRRAQVAVAARAGIRQARAHQTPLTRPAVPYAPSSTMQAHLFFAVFTTTHLFAPPPTYAVLFAPPPTYVVLFAPPPTYVVLFRGTFHHRVSPSETFQRAPTTCIREYPTLSSGSSETSKEHHNIQATMPTNSRCPKDNSHSRQSRVQA